MNTLNLALLQQDDTSGMIWTIAVIIGMLIHVFIFIAIWASRYVKVGPNEALIITGRTRTGSRIVTGDATFVWPVLEEAKKLSLEVLTVAVKTPSIRSAGGIPVGVEASAQVKVRGDEPSIRKAAEQFLSKEPGEICTIVHKCLQGHLASVIGKTPHEELSGNRAGFAQNVQKESTADFARMGLQIISLTITEIQDGGFGLDLTDQLIGREVEVISPIPSSGIGTVTYSISAPAKAADGGEVPTHASVRVVKLENNALVVEKQL